MSMRSTAAKWRSVTASWSTGPIRRCSDLIVRDVLDQARPADPPQTIPPLGVDDLQVVETIDESFMADTEAEKHARQAVRSAAIAVDSCSDLRLGHQERGRERVGQPLFIGASPQIPVGGIGNLERGDSGKYEVATYGELSPDSAVVDPEGVGQTLPSPIGAVGRPAHPLFRPLGIPEPGSFVAGAVGVSGAAGSSSVTPVRAGSPFSALHPTTPPITTATKAAEATIASRALRALARALTRSSSHADRRLICRRYCQPMVSMLGSRGGLLAVPGLHFRVEVVVVGGVLGEQGPLGVQARGQVQSAGADGDVVGLVRRTLNYLPEH